jgi:hypothetical protein
MFDNINTADDVAVKFSSYLGDPILHNYRILNVCNNSLLVSKKGKNTIGPMKN